MEAKTNPDILSVAESWAMAHKNLLCAKKQEAELWDKLYRLVHGMDMPIAVSTSNGVVLMNGDLYKGFTIALIKEIL